MVAMQANFVPQNTYRRIVAARQDWNSWNAVAFG